jgi:hypothetical protein
MNPYADGKAASACDVIPLRLASFGHGDDKQVTYAPTSKGRQKRTMRMLAAETAAQRGGL